MSRSRNPVTKSAGTVPPDSVISVRMRNTSKSTFTRLATAWACPYSITRFWSKKANDVMKSAVARFMRCRRVEDSHLDSGGWVASCGTVIQRHDDIARLRPGVPSQQTVIASAAGERASRSQKVAFDTNQRPSTSTASPSRPSKITWSFSRIE